MKHSPETAATIFWYNFPGCLPWVLSYIKRRIYATTLCLKKVPTFKLSVTLSNLNQFSKRLRQTVRLPNNSI